MPPTRHHTPPPLPTPEHNLIRLEIHENKMVELQGQIANLRRQLNTAEKRLVEVCGMDGNGGTLKHLNDEQKRSAESQGKRIGKVESSIDTMEEDLKELEVSHTDTRARMYAGVAVVLALASLAVKALF